MKRFCLSLCAMALKIFGKKFICVLKSAYGFCLLYTSACWGLGAISGHAYKTGDIGDNVFMVMVFLLVSSLLELPLNIYETFVKDKMCIRDSAYYVRISDIS